MEYVAKYNSRKSCLELPKILIKLYNKNPELPKQRKRQKSSIGFKIGTKQFFLLFMKQNKQKETKQLSGLSGLSGL